MKYIVAETVPTEILKDLPAMALNCWATRRHINKIFQQGEAGSIGVVAHMSDNTDQVSEQAAIDAWLLYDDDSTSKAQRRALHRCGYNDWLIGKMNRYQAAKAIAEAIKRIGEMKAEE